MTTSQNPPMQAAIQAARKLHEDHNSFERTHAAVRRSAYNLLDAMDALPAEADCQPIASELDPEDMRLLQTAGMDGGDAIDRLAQAGAC